MPYQMAFSIVTKPEKKSRPVRLEPEAYTAKLEARILEARPEGYVQERTCEFCNWPEERVRPCMPCWMDQWYSRLKRSAA